MRIDCVWEHNSSDTLLYADMLPGAFTRGASYEEAAEKMPAEIRSWLQWSGQMPAETIELNIIQEKASDLMIRDADSDVIFESERKPLTQEEYEAMKSLVLRSAEDFQRLYDSILRKDETDLPLRSTFYSNIPRTAREMYEHTKSVNVYYFTEIDVEADTQGSIVECRKRGFEALEQKTDYLENTVFDGSYGEEWSLRKLMRRFIWHDRIHAKAMYRQTVRMYGKKAVPDPFYFRDIV